ncbi:MAG: host-nuclease inhibitor Gam family protein [Bacteroidota bacterium]|jgi:hypothetical protein
MTPSFMDELLAEAEIKEKEDRLEMSRLRADQVLAALAVLEKKAAEVNDLADEEAKLVEEFRESELQKIEKKASWLAWQLEGFIRSMNQQDPSCKSIALPHGVLKLRLGRDKIEITNMETFVELAEKRGLLKTIPESFEPDMQKTLAYVKQNGFLAGVTLIPAQSKFSYTTKGNGNGKAEQSEAGIEVE